MFLSKVDLTTNVFPEIIDKVSRYDEGVLLAHMATAESEIESHLCGRYDIRPELNKTGGDRNPLLLNIAKTLAVCYIYQPLETTPAKIEKSCDRAAKLLEMMTDGRIKLPGVPPPPEEEIPTTGADIGWGSTPKRGNYY